MTMNPPDAHFPKGVPDGRSLPDSPISDTPKSDSLLPPERSLHWHLLGGNNKHRIGANAGLCVFEETDSMGEKRTTRVLFDAGSLIGDSKYPEYPELSPCDTVIPDMAPYLKKRGGPDAPEPLDAIFLTHNHVDHLGALPFLTLMGYEVPKVYATPYTVKRLEQEYTNAGIDPDEWPEMIAIAPGKPVQEGPVKVSAFWVSHSTPQSVGFFIETPEGNILNPGDFKLDKTVVWGPAFSEEQFHRVVNKPVDVLLLDSTGADRDIVPTTEEDVREQLRELMEKYPGKRFVIAVMSGFEENLASVAKVSAEYDRTLWVSGWSHEQSLAALKATGMTLSDHLGQDVDLRVLATPKSARDLDEQKPGRSVVVVTGAAGSPSSALPRAAAGEHPQLQLDKKNDIILFCAPSIPGQEASRERLLSMLRGKGFQVLTRQEATLYSQAHARLPELVDMVKMANPKTVLPIHGDAELRAHNAEAVEKMGKKVLQADNGDVIRVTKDGCKSTEPASKGKPKFVGFRTLQGQHWWEKNYMMMNAPQEKPAGADNAANNNQKPKRPKIFNVNPK